MSKYKFERRVTERAAKAKRTRAVIWFYNQVTGLKIEKLEEIPMKRLKAILSVGHSNIAKAYGRHLVGTGKRKTESAIKCGIKPKQL